MSFAKYALIAAATFAVIGCEKAEDQKAVDATQNKVDSQVKDATKSMDTAKAKSMDALDTAKDKAGDAAKMAGDAAGAMEIPGLGKVEDVMTKIKTYIEEKKLDDAQALVDKADAYKDKMPDAVKTQFESLKGLLGKAKDAAKLMGGTAAPAMPAMPK